MALTNQEIKDKLIEAGIKNLTEYGFVNVHKDNICTNRIFAGFFKEILQENKGKSTKQIDNVIDELIAETNITWKIQTREQ